MKIPILAIAIALTAVVAVQTPDQQPTIGTPLADNDLAYLVGSCATGPGELKANPPLACVGAPSVAGVACVPKKVLGVTVCCLNPTGVTEQDTGCPGENQDDTKASLYEVIVLPVEVDCADRIETQCDCQTILGFKFCKTITINHGKCGTKHSVPNCAS